MSMPKGRGTTATATNMGTRLTSMPPGSVEGASTSSPRVSRCNLKQSRGAVVTPWALQDCG
jgi:hypothetical protein